MTRKLIFSTRSYSYLKERLLLAGSYDSGVVEVKYFPDGELYQQIQSDVNGRDAVVIGGTISDTDTLELYDLAYSIPHYGVSSLVLVIPYFGYSTMERAVKPGEVVTAKTRAHLLSSLPRPPRGIRVVLMDLHSEGIPYYFESTIRPIHLYCKPLIVEAARELGGDDFILASTDAGRAKWVESLANDMGVNAAFLLKRRLSGSATTVTSINADVDGKHVIIYDDMVRSGSSLVNAAQAYKHAGAERISVITTHGLFTDGGVEKLAESGLIERIVCTDTHPHSVSEQFCVYRDFLTVKSVAGLVAQTIDSL